MCKYQEMLKKTIKVKKIGSIQIMALYKKLT